MFPCLKNKKILYLNDRHEEKDTQNEDRRKLYDKRILSLLDKSDLAVFGGEIDSFLWDYYKTLGLAKIKQENIFYVDNYLDYPSLTKALLANGLIIEQIKKKKPQLLLPYIESKDTQILSKKLNTSLLRRAQITEQVNNKSNYRQIIEKLGFPVIAFSKVSSLKEARKSFGFLRKQGFKRIVLKKERSVAGFGVFVIKTERDLEKQIRENFFQEKSFLLEGFVENVETSPNVQYWVGPKEIRLIVVSDQLLAKDQISHTNNVFPAKVKDQSEIWRKIEKLSLSLGNYLQSENCYGLIGIDYLITKDKKIYSTEANVRLNASTFAALIAKKLFIRTDNIYWKTFTLKGYSLSFEKLFHYLKHLFINQKGGFGVFPIDVGILDLMGEGQFMSIGSSLKQVDEFAKEAVKVYEDLSKRKMQ